MKLYHKLLLYKNKTLQAYVRFVLRLLAVFTTLSSILFIGAVIYQHGFHLTKEDVERLHLI